MPVASPSAETAPSSPDNTRRLLEHLRDNDALCPVCNYNLRGLTETRCPECDHRLTLTVGVSGVRVGWFVATIAPFMSAGLAAVALGSLLVIAELAGGDPPPIVHLLMLLGLCSGAVAALIFWKRHRFMAFPQMVQRNCAAVAWLLHAIPFAGLLILMLATT